MIFEESDAAQFINMFNIYLRRLNINYYDEDDENYERETEDSLDKEDIKKEEADDLIIENDVNK